MKKNISIFFICTIMALACNKKASPSKTVTERGAATAPAKTEDAAAANKPADTGSKTIQPNVAEAGGKTLYSAKCTRCHADKGVENFTADRWDTILNSMIPKAKLTDEEALQVKAYIKANCKK